MTDEQEVRSEMGDDPFVGGAAAQRAQGRQDAQAFVRNEPGEKLGWGRGPIAVDRRKHRYDRTAALMRPMVPFSASKVDRLDAEDAGDMLESIHVLFGINTQPEERLLAFDNALWYEHAVNGGSTLQAERGSLFVDGVAFDIPPIVKKLGVDARRFFRAYADDVAVCLRQVLSAYDPYNPVSVEMHAAVMQVAVARGLQKYPYLIHDSSDACASLSVEERMALLTSKRYVISSSVNAADSFVGRVGQSAGFGSAAAIREV